MINPYKSKLAKIIKIRQQTPDTKLFTVKYVNKKDQDIFVFNHGQFMMAGLAGFGEAPFDICSNVFDASVIEFSIRKVGELTTAIHNLKVGDEILMRGPFGNGLPRFSKLEKNNILLIGGGCGFVTMKSLIEDLITNHKDRKVQVFYGALNEENLLFKSKFNLWQKDLDLQIILSDPKEKWKWKTGLITQLFKEVKVIDDATVIMCGPPVMYRFVIKELEKLYIRPEDIYLSMERRMHCGVGICHHCAIGSKLVCKDGPVFRYDEIKDVEGAI